MLHRLVIDESLRARRRRLMVRVCAVFLAVLVLTWASRAAWAIPALQIYIEGSTYDSATETWVASTTGSFRLWVVGDIGHYGEILGIKLSGAVLSSETGSITLSPTTTSLLLDSSISSSPTPTGNFPSADGAVPIRGDSSSLPTHGIYGPGVSFFEWDLGNFSLTDSPVGDFIAAFPTSFPDSGQINVYDITVSGFSEVHFDAYNHIYTGGNHGRYTYVTAPFSHDGETTVVPEPASLLLLGSGLLGLGLLRRKRHR